MPRRKIYRLDLSQAEEHSLKTSSGDVQYRLLRSPRRRTMEIRVMEDGLVRIVAPVYVALREIEGFLHERVNWVISRQQEMQRIKQFIGCRSYETGQEFLFLGKNYPLYIQEEKCCRITVLFDQHGWVVTLPMDLAPAERKKKIKENLVKWYKREAHEVFGARVFHFVRLMHLEPMTISVKTQRAVWGLCAYYAKSIAFNWLLVLAPMHVIDYVIVHELAHLTHPNHSKRFWNKVEKFLPDYKERQDWLKNHRLEMKLP